MQPFILNHLMSHGPLWQGQGKRPREDRHADINAAEDAGLIEKTGSGGYQITGKGQIIAMRAIPEKARRHHATQARPPC